MTKIQLRRDTAANWSTNNPTPSAGEPCFETDTGKLKIGDGTTAYNNLAYQGGGASIDDTTTATDKAWSSDKVNTELSKKQDTLPTTDAGYDININSNSVAGQTVYFGGNTSSSLAPHAKANSTDHILNINGYGTDGSGITMYDTVLKTNSFKYGNNTTQYEVVNKSPANNTYMAHMAMPSDKYIDLELGASGTAYTAPADGYAYCNFAVVATGEQFSLQALSTSNNLLYFQRITAATKTSLAAMIPVRKNNKVGLIYNVSNTKSHILRFIYAAGSSPTD